MYLVAPFLLLAVLASSASPFCNVSPSAPYEDILESAQQAFSRGQYRRSRSCYLVALHRYWREYDAASASSLAEATAPQMEHFAGQAVAMQQQLSQLSNHGAAIDEEDTASDLGPAHHIPGQHPVPPGSAVSGHESELTTALPNQPRSGFSRTQGVSQKIYASANVPLHGASAPQPAMVSSPHADAPPTASKASVRAPVGIAAPVQSSRLLHDSDVETLSSLPRRQQIRELERIARDGLRRLHMRDGSGGTGRSSTDAASASIGSQASAIKEDARNAPLSGISAEDLDAGWA